MVGGLRAGPGRSHATRSGQTGSAPARRGFSKQPRISPRSWASSPSPRLVAKLVADSAAREGFPQTGRESASSLKPSRNDYLRPRGTVKETGGGPCRPLPCQLATAPARELAKFSIGGSAVRDRKSTRLNSSHLVISYAVFCLKKKKKNIQHHTV